MKFVKHIKTVILLTLCILALSGITQAKTSDSTQKIADQIFPDLIKLDTHLHVDIPMEARNFPPPEVDLRTAMKEGGFDGIVMSFAVDYVPLIYTGHAYTRFLNAMDAYDIILQQNQLSRTLDGKELLAHKKKNEPVLIQEVEGAHFLEGDVSRLQTAYDRGLRILTLLHDNDAVPALGDVYTNPVVYGGLTDLGADTIRECERLGILVDLAHASDDTVIGALKVATKPVIISHTGLNTQAGSNEFMTNMMMPRLINKETALLIASHGGVIGIWPHLADTPERYAENIKAMVDIVGIDHVMIGTDEKITPEISEFVITEKERKQFDDAPKNQPQKKSKDFHAINHVWSDVDDSFYHSVVVELLKQGLTKEDIAKIAGENFLRVFTIATEK